MKVQAVSPAAQARRGTVAIREAETSLMLGEFVHIECDQGPAVESIPARKNQARIRRRGCPPRSHPDHDTANRGRVQVFGAPPPIAGAAKMCPFRG